MQHTLGDLANGRKNNFDFIRFIAATMVIVSHSFLLSYGDENLDPLVLITLGQENDGAVGVFIFFIISGFLIAQSYDRRPQLIQFLKARILRIFPGLAVVLLFTAFIIGTLVNLHNLPAYYSSGQVYRYLLNIELWSIPFVQYKLGLFWHNVFTVEENGSLWTLYYEFVCYLVVAVMGFTRTLRRPFVLVLFVFGYIMTYHNFPGDPRLSTTFYFLRFFSTGMLFYIFRKYIPHRWYLAVTSIAVIVASVYFHQLYNLLPIPLGYLIFYVAFWERLKLHNFAKYGDFSYGLYIYAFPIQQLVTWYYGGKMHAHTNFLIAFPVTVGLAYLSWHLVEKRCLKLKDKNLFNRSKLPIANTLQDSK